MQIHGVHINDQPNVIFPDVENTQCLIVEGKTLPLKMRGPLLFLPVQRPTTFEVKNSEVQILQLTSPHGWDPYSTDTISTQHMLKFAHGCQISTFFPKNYRILSRL